MERTPITRTHPAMDDSFAALTVKAARIQQLLADLQKEDDRLTRLVQASAHLADDRELRKGNLRGDGEKYEAKLQDGLERMQALHRQLEEVQDARRKALHRDPPKEDPELRKELQRTLGREEELDRLEIAKHHWSDVVDMEPVRSMWSERNTDMGEYSVPAADESLKTPQGKLQIDGPELDSWGNYRRNMPKKTRGRRGRKGPSTRRRIGNTRRGRSGSRMRRRPEKGAFPGTRRRTGRWTPGLDQTPTRGAPRATKREGRTHETRQMAKVGPGRRHTKDGGRASSPRRPTEREPHHRQAKDLRRLLGPA